MALVGKWAQRKSGFKSVFCISGHFFHAAILLVPLMTLDYVIIKFGTTKAIICAPIFTVKVAPRSNQSVGKIPLICVVVADRKTVRDGARGSFARIAPLLVNLCPLLHSIAGLRL